MPAERTPRGAAGGSIRNQQRRRDSYASNASNQDHGPFRPTSPLNGFTPYGTITPGNSRPGSPFNKQQAARHSRKTDSSNQSYTTLLAPVSPPLSEDGTLSNSMDAELSTITWESATASIENKKTQTVYEKPVYGKNGEIVSYGKVLTKTVVMTIVTTIASTDVLHPGEDGYQASIERYQKQQQDRTQPQQKPTTKQQTSEDVKFEDKPFAEVFSPEQSTEQERQNIFRTNPMNQPDILNRRLRSNFHAAAPSSPPCSPTISPRQE